MIKQCISCGRDFGALGTAITCSDFCRRERRTIMNRFKARRMRAEKPPPISECRICGKEFRQFGSAVTCGPDCSRVNKRRQLDAWLAAASPEYWHRRKQQITLWRQRNPEARAAVAKRYRQNHLEETRARNARWRANNLEHMREIRRRWAKANHERRLANARRLRLRRAAALAALEVLGIKIGE